jgi:uncharacterized protein (TIGR04255 family)
MDSKSPLPKFRRPPLIEVVHGVQFDRLQMTVIHPGLFYAQIRDEFPKSRTVPALPPLALTQPSAQSIQFADPGEVPRAWFLDENEINLVQLQADRLLLNWRQEPSKAEYPHFEEMHAKFGKIYQEFQQFVSSEGLGTLRPRMCEMIYINHIAMTGSDGKPWPAHEWFVPWQENYGPGWATPSDAVNWVAQYPIRRDDGSLMGRLTATLSNVVRPPSSDRALLFDLTVQGTPRSEDFAGVTEFHHIAHRAIVTYFAAVTTGKAHDEWGIIQ